MKQQNLIIVEDDPFHRKFLEDQLSSPEFSHLFVSSFENGEDALAWLANNQTHYAVIDLQLAGKNGIDVARRVWQGSVDSAVVFWSNFSDPAYVRAISKIVPVNGNFGYLLKTTSPQKLVRSLQGVFFDGQRVVDSEIQGLIKRQNSRAADLSSVEIELLNLVALGLTDRSISELTGMSARSVQTMISNIYDKVAWDVDLDDARAKLLNRRCHLVGLALMRGEINRDSLLEQQKRLDLAGL